MARYLDTASWHRREAFAYFRAYDKPYFSVCTRVDAAALKAATVGGGLSLACMFIALRLANVHEAFRLRLDNGRVRVHEVVHGSTTVLRDDESFGFADLPHDTDFERFAAAGASAIAAVRAGHLPFEPRVDDSALVHFTTLPWVHFTSFSHARNWGREDSVPKISFGRIDADGARQWLPLSVEVHHALMDGLHLGRWVQDFETALQQPEAWLRR